ncbi:hypothetical protein M885DRAFT_524132, partial [Pelagophyceae sp. CCMP2097]
MLSSAALDAAIEALPEEGALLPLQLSLAVAALQRAISAGVLREGHVAVQGIYRSCLQLYKAERSVPPETFDALRSLNEPMRANHGLPLQRARRGTISSHHPLQGHDGVTDRHCLASSLGGVHGSTGPQPKPPKQFQDPPPSPQAISGPRPPATH